MDSRKAETMLSALGRVLDDEGCPPVDVVVCGAMALLMRGIIERPTRDIDGLGFVVEKGGKPVLVKPRLSGRLKAAVERVGSLYGEGKHWFSTAATVLHDDTELPPDIVSEAEVKRYGSRLTVRLCSRRHLAFLKMWAAVHRGEPDIGDLARMALTPGEAEEAADWCLRQDREALPRLAAVLEEIGHGEVVARIAGGD
jgi:hypothetical protein